MTNRITLYQYSDVSSRMDMELSENSKRLYLIEMSDYSGSWQETVREEIPIEVLTKGLKLQGIQDRIEKKAKKRWDRLLFRLISKVDTGEITYDELKLLVKYKKEQHSYPKGNPKI